MSGLKVEHNVCYAVDNICNRQLYFHKRRLWYVILIALGVFIFYNEKRTTPFLLAKHSINNSQMIYFLNN